MNLISKKQLSLKFSGSIALLASGFSFSLMTVCVKHLQGRIPVPEIVFTRAIISLIMTRAMLWRLKVNPWGNNKKLLIVRGIMGTGALFCIFKAIGDMPIAPATIIQYTYPTFIAILASIFLKEKLRKRIVLAIISGWIGILLVLQPDWLTTNSQEISITALLIGLSGALLTAFAYICVRQLSKKEHPLVIIHYFPLISVPVSLPFLINNSIIPIGIEWVWLLGIGITTQMGQLWITQGLKLLPAAQASSFNYSQVLFATLWGVLIFSEPINEYIAIGGVFILSATLISVSARIDIT